MQQGNHLARQGHSVWAFHFHSFCWDDPGGSVEIKLAPFSPTQSNGSYEDKGENFQSKTNGGFPGVCVNGSEQMANFCRVADRNVVIGLNRGEGFCKASGNIITGMPHNARVTRNLAA